VTAVTLVAGQSFELLAKRKISVWLISYSSLYKKNKMPNDRKSQFSNDICVGALLFMLLIAV